MRHDSNIDHLMAVLKYLNSWNTLELGLQGSGASKLRDGGYLLDAEIFVSASVPNGAAVDRASRLLRGEAVEVAERNPVADGEQLASPFLGGIGASDVVLDVDSAVRGEEDEAVEPPPF